MMLAKLEDLARGNLASKEFSSSIPNKVDFYREVGEAQLIKKVDNNKNKILTLYYNIIIPAQCAYYILAVQCYNVSTG